MSHSSKKTVQINKTTFIAILLIALTVIAICVTLIFLNIGSEKLSTVPPDYAPRETESNMESVGGDDDKLPQSNGGGAVGLSYSIEVVIDLSDNEAALLVENPMKSNQDMLLQLVIHDNLILQSGRITPGHRLTKLSLVDGAADLLSVGGYDGSFKFYYYNPDTGEKAIVNTNIPVNVTVVA